jgi:sugar lactone lactonase YvrE
MSQAPAPAGGGAAFSAIASGFDSPEGPAFDRQGNLYFVNWLTSAIVRLGPDGTPVEVANTAGIPAGLAFHPDGTLYIADEGAQHHGVLRLDAGGALTPWLQAYEGQPLNGANDLVFDQQGVLYFSDPWGSTLARPIGGFYRAFPDGRLERLDSGLAFPNGVAVAPDGSAVYLAETGPNRVLRYATRAPSSPSWRAAPGRTGWPSTSPGTSTSPTTAKDGWTSSTPGGGLCRRWRCRGGSRRTWPSAARTGAPWW